MVDNLIGSELDDLKEIIEDFLVEADELTQSLDSNFVKLESAPRDLELLNEIFRAAHTIKGTSSFLGFDSITELAHKMEDVLNMLRRSELIVTADIMDVLLASLDQLKALLDIVRKGKKETADISSLVSRLVAVSKGSPTGDAVARSEAAWSTGTLSHSYTVESGASESAAATIAGREESARKHLASDQTIRVDVDRLDTLMNMMGELVLGRNSLVQAVNQINVNHEGESQFESMNQATAAVNFITSELQMAVMKMRMQPVGKVFNKFPRLVRDLARDQNKQIQLLISGEGTELDKSVIEEIGDPLVHILRNCCDHGLETPQERKAAGKSELGTIHLDASQEGSNIVIKVSDDGRGFDVDTIRKRAVEYGLATEDEIESMEDHQVYGFVLEPGFSTAKVITGVSGRGVGMDVVRTNIEKLNGILELDSIAGQGSDIVIKLPLTLAIIRGLLVESDEEIFVLPLSSVWETVKSDKTQVYYVNQRPVFRLRDEIIPIVSLNHILQGRSRALTLTEKPYIVVVGLGERKLGIIIDRFLGQEEVVIKSLGNFLSTSEGIAGATILGDGRVRLIIDLIGLFKLAKSTIDGRMK